MDAYPNEPHAVSYFSLGDAVLLYRSAVRDNHIDTDHATEKEQETFVNNLLCGRWDEQHRRMALDPCLGVAAPGIDEVTITRDVDSLFGITKNLPYNAPLSVFPVPSFSETLKTNVHLNGPVLTPTVWITFTPADESLCRLSRVVRTHLCTPSPTCRLVLSRSGIPFESFYPQGSALQFGARSSPKQSWANCMAVSGRLWKWLSPHVSHIGLMTTRVLLRRLVMCTADSPNTLWTFPRTVSLGSGRS